MKNLYKKCIAKPYYFLVIDATIVSDNLSRFWKNPSKKKKRKENLIIQSDDKIRDEKLQYDINW